MEWYYIMMYATILLIMIIGIYLVIHYKKKLNSYKIENKKLSKLYAKLTNRYNDLQDDMSDPYKVIGIYLDSYGRRQWGFSYKGIEDLLRVLIIGYENGKDWYFSFNDVARECAEDLIAEYKDRQEYPLKWAVTETKEPLIEFYLDGKMIGKYSLDKAIQESLKYEQKDYSFKAPNTFTVKKIKKQKTTETSKE